MKYYRETLLVICFFSVAYLSYGTGRTMQEEMGITGKGVCSGLLLTAFFISLLYGVNLIVLRIKILPLILIGSIILGILTLEILILHDEFQFIIESEAASRIHTKADFSRPRAWPYSSGLLLWSHEQGLWTTD